MPNPALQLWNNERALDGLTFGLSFATDDEIRQIMFMKYAFYEMAYPSPRTMNIVLQAHANLWSDYFNDMYETTQFSYNPIENYSMTETTNTTRGVSRQIEVDVENSGTTTNKQKPYNAALVDTSTQSASTTGNTTEGVVENGDENTTHTRSGNIGVTTSQQMIAAERDILLNMRNFVVDHFKDYFMLTI